ncbi:hypothetical protein ACIGW0_31675 [Streptomyces bikiniensis]|uniref:Uncharacterized protein n=1 Tax=Streptomyces bikiniensis TaxID=1896 RepID=A0ABW8D4G7_STRBI
MPTHGPCAHPGRDLSIVGLSAALSGTVSFTVMELLNTAMTTALTAGAATAGVVATLGLAVLMFLKHG